MGKYVLKAGIVEAIQYRRDDNIHEVQDFFDRGRDHPQKFKYQATLNEYAVALWAPVAGPYLQVLERGDYIIRHANGTYEILKEPRFKERYERVAAG